MDGRVAIWDLRMGVNNANNSSNSSSNSTIKAMLGSSADDVDVSILAKQPRQVCLLTKHKYGVLSVAYCEEQVSQFEQLHVVIP
jgi:hypothetical protein